MEDLQIISLYWQRNPDAVTRTKEKYGPYCFSVASRILSSYEDCEECVNDTYLHAWNSIPPQRPEVLRLFLAKITRNLSFDYLRKHSAQKRSGDALLLSLEELAQCICDEGDVEDTLIAEELASTVNCFLHSLPPRECNLFLRRYFFADSIKEIAKDFAMTPNHVTVILRRTREKLKQHLIKEGYFHEPK